MKGLRDTLVDWVDARTKNMLATPRAWGSDEAVEMQILLLLQVRALALRPELEIEAPGRLVDAYLTYLTKAYPERPHRPLHQIVEADRLGLNLAAELRKVVDIFTRQTLAENPFQHHELAIRLVFEQGRTPATSAVTGYYEEFRRACRAVARPFGKTAGRATKSIEDATDFALSDVRVNGAQSHASRFSCRSSANRRIHNERAPWAGRDCWRVSCFGMKRATAVSGQRRHSPEFRESSCRRAKRRGRLARVVAGGRRTEMPKNCHGRGRSRVQVRTERAAPCALRGGGAY